MRIPPPSPRRIARPLGAGAVRVALLAVSLAALPGVPTALADDTPGGRPKRNEFDFGPTERGPTKPRPGATASDPAARGTAAPEEDPTTRQIREEIAALSTWPDRSAVRAAESLLLRGDVAVPLLVDALAGKESLVQPGAAWVLGQVGEPAHVVAILRAAAERANGSRAEEFFDAAYGVDPARTKEWLFSFITVMGRPVFREKATTFLASKATAEDRDRVLKLLAAPKPEVRASGLRLLDGVRLEDAPERLVQALSDVSPDVASVATKLLATRGDAAMTARLNALSRDGDARERAYATLALSEMARAQAVNPYEPATLAELSGRRGLLHPEKLARGAAAVGLAYGALASTDVSLSALLDGPVVDVLIDSVGGQHFRDYSSLSGPTFAALRRLSGVDLPETATAWAQWWQSQRGRFRARRPLREVTEEDVARASVRFDLLEADGRRRRAVFTAENGAKRPDALVLPRPAFLALVDGLKELGLFEGSDALRAGGGESLTIALAVANQEKRLTIPASDPRYELVKIRFDSLEEANLWQRYRDEDQFPDAAVWWRTNQSLMADADPATRKTLLQAAIVQAYDDLLDDVARGAALDRLEEIDAPLSTAQCRILAKAVAAASTFGATEARAMRFITGQATAGEARDELIEILAVRTEPATLALTVDLVMQRGPAGVRDAFADPRPAVRAAAARAAARMLDEETDPDRRMRMVDGFRPGLEVLAKDPERTVAVGALLGLARVGDPTVLPALEALYKKGDQATRIAVTEALGAIPGDAAHPLLSLVLAEERSEGSGALRAAALRSLARTGHPNAVPMLGHYLLNDADPDVQRAAGLSLVELGTDEARFFLVDLITRRRQPDAAKRARLVDTLGRFPDAVAAEVLRPFLEDPDPVVAAAAALRLADHNDASTVPYLIRILKAGGVGRDEAPAALENVTSLTIEAVGAAEIAERYEQWYATTRSGNDRTWFRDALRRKGYDVGPLASYVEGEGDPSATPVLVRALRDEDSVIRRNAAVALQRITGRSFGTVARDTPASEAALVADRWNRWWTSVNPPR